MGVALTLATSEALPAEAKNYLTVAEFLDTLGVNVHLNYKDTAYADAAAVARDLHYLGIRHVRDALPMAWSAGGAHPEDFAYMVKAGVKFDLGVDGGKSFDPNVVVARADEVSKLMPGAIEAIEGFNEINNWPVTYKGTTSPAAADAAMRALYAALHADPHLAGVPVYDMTGAPTPMDLTGRADFANAHPYPHNGNPPAITADPDLKGHVGASVVTEIGNFSLPATWPAGKPWWEGYTMLGMDEESQAKSILLSYFSAAEAGIKRTYVYELLDEKTDPGSNQPEFHYGLFHHDHSPKAAAVAIHNLTTFLAGAGGASPPMDDEPPPLKLLNAPPHTHLLYIRGGQKTWFAAVWIDAPFWKWTGPTAERAPKTSIDIKLEYRTKILSISKFDTINGETTKLLSLNSKNYLSVYDHPVIIYYGYN